MNILKLDTPIVGLNKEPITEINKQGVTKAITIGNVIAAQIVNLTGLESKDAIRLFKIATDMFDANEIQVDDEKLDFIILNFSKVEQLPALFKGQILDFLNKSKKQ